MAKKAKPQITQKHVDNANEIAQLLSAMKGAGAEQQNPQSQEPAPPPSGMSPLGGQAK